MIVSNKYTSAEKQLITTLAWFRTRYALFMGLSLERKADVNNFETSKVFEGYKKMGMK
jgi:hypothetical protein